MLRQLYVCYLHKIILTSNMLSYFINAVIDTSVWISALISKDGLSQEVTTSGSAGGCDFEVLTPQEFLERNTQ